MCASARAYVCVRARSVWLVSHVSPFPTLPFYFFPFFLPLRTCSRRSASEKKTVPHGFKTGARAHVPLLRPPKEVGKGVYGGERTRPAVRGAHAVVPRATARTLAFRTRAPYAHRAGRRNVRTPPRRARRSALPSVQSRRPRRRRHRVARVRLHARRLRHAHGYAAESLRGVRFARCVVQRFAYRRAAHVRHTAACRHAAKTTTGPGCKQTAQSVPVNNSTAMSTGESALHIGHRRTHCS